MLTNYNSRQEEADVLESKKIPIISMFSTTPKKIGIFSIQKPKHIGFGLISGVRNILLGVGLGIISLFAVPVLGAREYGLKGFLLGIFGGLISTSALLISGLFSGLIQTCRGVINTPAAIYFSNRGKIWDKNKQKWIIYSLEEEFINIVDTDEKSLSRPKDTRLYEILGISYDSTSEEIKKAYYKKAKDCHPDKLENDNSNAETSAEIAQQAFQEIGHAYQILSNEKLRQQYHCAGLDSFEETNVLDAATFYKLFLGSETFEFFIGELQISSVLSGTNSINETQKIQEIREIKIAKNLVELINKPNSYIDELIPNLNTTPVGRKILNTIGQVYGEKSDEYLSFFKGVKIRMAQKKQDILNNINLFTSAVKSYKLSKQVGDNTSDIVAENTIDSILNTMWNLIIIDIIHVLRKACHKILIDTSVTKEERKIRAQQLNFIANKFKKYNSTKKEIMDYLKVQGY